MSRSELQRQSSTDSKLSRHSSPGSYNSDVDPDTSLDIVMKRIDRKSKHNPKIYQEMSLDIIDILIKEKQQVNCNAVYKLLLTSNIVDLIPTKLGFTSLFQLLGRDNRSTGWPDLLKASYKTSLGSDLEEDMDFLINCIKRAEENSSPLFNLIVKKLQSSKHAEIGIRDLQIQAGKGSPNAIYLLDLMKKKISSRSRSNSIAVSDIELNMMIDKVSCCDKITPEVRRDVEYLTIRENREKKSIVQRIVHALFGNSCRNIDTSQVVCVRDSNRKKTRRQTNPNPKLHSNSLKGGKTKRRK
jgi:hypothetical protein